MKKYLTSILFILGISNLIFAIGIVTNFFSGFEKIYALSSIMTVIAVFGVKKYKKWGVYLYFLAVLISLITYIYTSAVYFNYIILIIHLLLIYPVKYIWKEFN